MCYWNLRSAFDVDDLDILIESSLTNVVALKTALTEIEVPFEDVQRFARPREKMSLRLCDRYAFHADILTAPSDDFDFENAFSRAQQVSCANLDVRVASLDTLRQLKLAAVECLEAEIAKHRRDLNALRGG